MRLFNRFNGVPNSHLFILIVYICLSVFGVLLGLGYIIQDLLDGPIFNLRIFIINPRSWIIPLLLVGIFTIIIVITDILYSCLGDRSKYQMPLHRIVRAFYKRGNVSYTQDSTGQIVKLSSSELSVSNLAVRCSYLKPFDSGLKLIIPCLRWGYNGIINNIMNNLRSSNGSLDSAQHIVSSNFPGYRFRISHYHLSGHKIFWYLIRK